MSFKSVFEKIPFASLSNAIDVKIERVLTGFLVGGSVLLHTTLFWNKLHQVQYTRNQKTGKPNNLRARKPNNYKVTYVHLHVCLHEENLTFHNNYII